MASQSHIGSSVTGDPSLTPASLRSPVDSLSSNFIYRTQSEIFCPEIDPSMAGNLETLLDNDVHNRITYVGENISSTLFPDEAFGFVLNVNFQNVFIDKFLASNATFDHTKFVTGEKSCVNFLNGMISTIHEFIKATGVPSLANFKPQRYFVTCQDTPVKGASVKRKPDLMLIRLIDGCCQTEKNMYWTRAQALAETTRSKDPPMRIKETILSKNYLTFCSQAERDFLITLCFVGQGFFISVMDHSGIVETNPIPFQLQPNTLIFLRMVIGLAFLPDEYLGIDPSVTCHEDAESCGVLFETRYPPQTTVFPDAAKIIIPLANPPSAPVMVTGKGDKCRYRSISVGDKTYPILNAIFEAQTLIGRATKAFLVQTDDGVEGIVKDSWIKVGTSSEGGLLEGLHIPFCPETLQHCTLRNTSFLRSVIHASAPITEPREKRRVLMYPAGVHISDFQCLWELMLAFMDVAIAIICLDEKQILHRDISYTNILLREPGVDSREKQAYRTEIEERFGLSAIKKLRAQYKCREGLLIDFDYATQAQGPYNEGEEEIGEDSYVRDFNQSIENEQDRHSIVRTGTPPFIAIELLLFGSPHRVAHDLESLFYVLLFICTHLHGPFCDVSDPPLFGDSTQSMHQSPMKLWFQQSNFLALGHMKYSQMAGFFGTPGSVLSHISPYFKPLEPHLLAFWNALHPGITSTTFSRGKMGIQSWAQPKEIIEVFKKALQDPTLISELKSSPSILGKRSYPGELSSAPNSWDAIPTNTKQRNSTQSVRSRKIRLTGKQHRVRGG